MSDAGVLVLWVNATAPDTAEGAAVATAGRMDGPPALLRGPARPVGPPPPVASSSLLLCMSLSGAVELGQA